MCRSPVSSATRLQVALLPVPGEPHIKMFGWERDAGVDARLAMISSRQRMFADFFVLVLIQI
jgi:hypothetical protein